MSLEQKLSTIRQYLESDSYSESSVYVKWEIHCGKEKMILRVSGPIHKNRNGKLYCGDIMILDTNFQYRRSFLFGQHKIKNIFTNKMMCKIEESYSPQQCADSPLFTAETLLETKEREKNRDECINNIKKFLTFLTKSTKMTIEHF